MPRANGRPSGRHRQRTVDDGVRSPAPIRHAAEKHHGRMPPAGPLARARLQVLMRHATEEPRCQGPAAGLLAGTDHAP